MSKLTEELKLADCYSTYDFAGKGNVFINYLPACNESQLARYAQWTVNRPGYKVDPNNFHRNYTMEFSVNCRESKAPVLEEAKAWASAKYGIKEWAKTPYGGWMDVGFIKTRLAELKEIAAKKLIAEEKPND